MKDLDAPKKRTRNIQRGETDMDFKRFIKPTKKGSSMEMHIEVAFKPITQGRIKEKLPISLPPARVPKPNPAIGGRQEPSQKRRLKIRPDLA